jgi:NitT/TauT family transport system substrate-binding protein
MSKSSIPIAAGVIGVIAVLGLLRYHPWTHSGNGVSAGPVVHSGPNNSAAQSLTVGFLPVTCHLTCPVTDFASHTTTTGTNFNSQRFTDFPTMVDALKSKQIQATFMVVPLAMKLREEGVPVKLCYLGHRDGSEVIVAKDSTAKSLRDLKGKTFALPSPYCNQNLVIHKLMQDQGMQPDDIKFVYMAPPDMPTALASKGIDAYFVGEPFCAKAEVDKTGRVLYYARDIWPNFISCGLVVHEDLIKQRPDVVRDLVRGIARSGMWADTHGAEAARIAAPYFRQDPKLLTYVLTQQPRIVKYEDLTPTDDDLQKINDMAVQMGILKKGLTMHDLIDREFIPQVITPANIDPSKAPQAVSTSL